MSIPLPELDDRTFADLVEEARTLLPGLDPAWTDHNPSDPGITLVELLAWLTEMLLFAADQIPQSHTRSYLALLDGPEAPAQSGSLAEATAATMRRLHERYRAATPVDYEHLALHGWPGTAEAADLGEGGRVRRSRCVPRRNLAASGPARDDPAAGHVSLVVLPEPAPGEEFPRPSPALLAGLVDFLAPRRLLGVRHHVVGPDYVDLTVSAQLALRPDAPPDQALAAAVDALRAALSPITGGPRGTGRSFGQDVHVSEIYAVLEAVPLVDYTEEVQVSGPAPVVTPDGTVTGAALDDHQLARLSRVELVAYDVQARTKRRTWTAKP
jgi:hypothetical protein